VIDWERTTIILIGCHSVPDNTLTGLITSYSNKYYYYYYN